MISGLVSLCDELSYDLEMLEFVEREVGFVVASARAIVDGRKQEKTDLVTREALEEAAKANGILEE